MLLLLPSPSWAPKRCICRRSIGWWLCRLVRCDATGSRLLLFIGQWPPRLPEASTRMLAGKTCATTAQYLSYCSFEAATSAAPAPSAGNCWQSHDHYVLTYDTVNATESILGEGPCSPCLIITVTHTFLGFSGLLPSRITLGCWCCWGRLVDWG